MKKIRKSSAGVQIPYPLALLATICFHQPVYSSATLEEIVVTAQRREENLQEVPIAISAFSENFLANTGVTEAADLPMVTPGFTYTSQLGGAVPVLRGIGEPGANVGKEASVATYVDDVYYSMSSGADMALNNIERVEVLKGPQGTLFGRNATGGLIHIITKEPSHETSGKVQVSYGNYDTLGTNLYATTGLTDTLAADIAIHYEDQDEGWGENLATGNDVNLGDEFSIRSKWLFEPSEQTRITFSADYFENETSIGSGWRPEEGTLGLDGAITFAVLTAPPLNLTPDVAAPLAIAAATKAPSDYYDINMGIDPYAKHEQWGVSLKLEQEIGEMDLVSITAYREAENLRIFSQDATPLNLIDVQMPAYTDTFTQEFRLTGETDRLRWIAGVFYLKEELGWGALGRSEWQIIVPPGLLGDPFGVSRVTNDGEGENKSWAAFVQGSYHLTDQTTLTMGLRYTEDDKEIGGTSTMYATIPAAFTIPIPWEQQGDFEETTWRLALEHQLNDDILIYASYNRGFKGGFLDLIATEALAGNAITITEPEILDAYEIGMKSDWMGSRLRLNAAIFYYDFQDKHEQAVVSGGSATINAADATMQGGEVELQAILSDSLSVHAGVSFIDSEYDSFPQGQLFTPTGIGANAQTLDVDHAGNEVARTPEYSFNLGFVHEYALDSGSMTSSLNYYYNDGFYWEPENRLEQDSYALLNAQVTWEGNNGISVGIYGNNLTDEEYLNFGISGTAGDTVSVAAPRTYGIKVGYSF